MNVKRWIAIFMIASLPLMLLSCGQNLFGGEEETSSDDLGELLDKATTTEDYAAIVTAAQAVLDDVNAPDSDRQTAYAQKGEAQLGKLGLSPLDIASDLDILVSSSDSDDFANAFNLIKINSNDTPENDKVTLSQLSVAADSLNESADLAPPSSRGLAFQVGSKLDSNFHMTRAITNTLMVILIVEEVYTISDSGEPVLLDTSIDSLAALTKLMNPAVGVRSVLAYASAAIDGYTKADALTPKQLEQVTLIETVAINIDALYTKAVAGLTWDFKTISYDFSGSIPEKNTAIESAVKAVFQDVTQ